MTAPDLPPWAGTLRDDDALAAELTLRWLDPHEALQVREEWLAIWDDVPYEAGFHAAGRARLARSLPLAIGPTRERRLRRTASSLVLGFDPATPDAPWISLADTMPPQAWAIGGPRPESLRAALAPYLIADDPPLVALPRCERIVKVIELDDHAALEQIITELDLWVDDATWGSAHDDDPWTSWRRDLGMLDLANAGRDAAREHPGRFPTLGCRTLWSRSVVRIERHPFKIWVFEARYVPADDAPVIRALNELLGIELPLDLPVDVAASLLRDRTVGPAEIAGGQDQDLWYAAPALAHAPGDPTSFALLARWLERAEGDHVALADVARLAIAWGHDGLVHELAATLAPGDLRDALVDELRPRGAGERAP